MKLIKCLFFILVFNYVSVVSAKPIKLKVATYNIGMLNVGNPVPFFKERLKFLKPEILKLIKEDGFDILAIQEAWKLESHKILSLISSEYIFLSIDADAWVPYLEHKTGLGFLVKKSLKPRVDFINYKTREAYTCGFGQICDRGMLRLRISLNQRDFYFLNTHLTPMYNLTKYRKNQISEILSEVKKTSILADDTSVFILGDFNISDVFGNLLETDDGTKKDWQDNAKLYSLFFKDQSLACTDTYEKNRDGYLFTQHRETNKTAKVSKSSGLAPSQRNDFIIHCLGGGKLRTVFNKLIFNKALNEEMHLSDHYGVYAEVEVM